MALHPPDVRAFPQTLGKGQLLCETLERAFDVSFSVWAKDPCWQSLFTTRQELDAAADSRRDEETRQHLQNQFHATDVKLVEFDTRRQLMIAPIVNNAGLELAVCGLVERGEARLVPHVVSAALRNIDLSHKVDAADVQLNAYACQVTSDFEELTWLRGLAEHIDLCDPTTEAATVADSVLPSLRELIQADTLAYFPNRGSTTPAPISPHSGLAAPYIVGGSHVSESRCRNLIEHLESEAIGQPVVRNAASHRGHLAGFPEVRSCILIRVAKGNSLFGWLLALNKVTSTDGNQTSFVRADSLSEWEFGTFEVGLVSAAMVMLAAHARNVELFREKEAMLIGVIRALINSIDAKDAYTCGHSDRVALIARRLAEQLGLPRAECERIYMAGLLHDVGKIGVPDAVLSKPGKLTDEEFAQIKKHPEIGHSILKHVAQLSYVLPGVLHHHEAIDGRGYPHNLAGENIPLQGRILAVADAYDAMTSTRPYRIAMPTEKAESILREGAGRQWDAQVIDAFYAALNDIRDIRGTSVEHMQVRLGKTHEATTSAKAPVDAISAAVNAQASTWQDSSFCV